MQLPFSFSCSCKNDNIPAFPQSILSSLVQSTQREGSESIFNKLDREYAALLMSWTPESALKAAIQTMASKGFLHPDIEWRHVALLPVFDAEDCMIALVPILIDLEGVKQINTEVAYHEMMLRVEELLR